MECLAEAVTEGGHQEDIDERVGDRVERRQQEAYHLDRRVYDVDCQTSLAKGVVDNVVTNGQHKDYRNGYPSFRHQSVRIVNHTGMLHRRRIEPFAKRDQYPPKNERMCNLSLC